MSMGGETGPEHHSATRRSGFRYFFYAKHHGRWAGDAAQWARDLSHEEEFAVFDDADWHEIASENRWLYGLRRRGADGRIHALGTEGQYIAEFPFAREGQAWHGYPLWPLDGDSPASRRGQFGCPPKAVFVLMQNAGLINARERQRLAKGAHL